MNSPMWRQIVTVAVALAAGGVQAAHPVQSWITTESLLAEMTDLAGMATFPSPAYVCRQFSSYDRASKSPAQGGNGASPGSSR